MHSRTKGAVIEEHSLRRKYKEVLRCPAVVKTTKKRKSKMLYILTREDGQDAEATATVGTAFGFSTAFDIGFAFVYSHRIINC